MSVFCMHIDGTTCDNCKDVKHAPPIIHLDSPTRQYQSGYMDGYGAGFKAGLIQGAEHAARATQCDICGELVRTNHSDPESYYDVGTANWVHVRCVRNQEEATEIAQEDDK